ncbi:hypothetical protein BKA61DRAFT_657002 [Leptodontidium sp. MPI-SDFR-AT-0119]|nr:hypothetical protein BKA61DRAFT_657002 [Leptodontidium sp. MPI-SDFR-AT-0119]
MSADNFRIPRKEARRLIPQQGWVDFDDSSSRYPAPGQLSEEYKPRNDSTKRSLTYRIGQWFWDVGGLIAAVAILIAIAIILRNYDGQIQPNWRFSFNLNSLVAILMTVLRTTMMEVVSDFLLGAAITILSLATGLFAQQVVISVPFVIQETGFVGTLPFRRYVSSLDVYRIGAGLWVLDYSTKAALIDAMANPTGNNSAVTPSCPTGNCTFASYDGITHSSIGLCTQCADITSSATEVVPKNTTYTNGGFNFTLPNGLAISDTLPAGTGYSYIDVKWDTDLDFGRPSAGISEIGSISVLQFTASGCITTANDSYYDRTCQPQSNMPNRTSSMSVLGVRCSYQACLKNYNSRIIAGTLNDTIVSTIPAPSSDPLGGTLTNVNFTTAKLPCVINGESYSLSNISTIDSTNITFVFVSVNGQNVSLPEQCVYEISEIIIKALSDFMSPEMTGNGIVSSAGGGINGMLSNPNFYSGNWWLASLYNRGNATFDSVSANLENLATTFTNYMRVPRQNFLDEYATPTLIAAYAPSTIEEGAVEQTSICTQFNWPWLIFPASLILATAALLCMTSILRHYDSLELPNWKASLLPLLFYGFDDARPGIQAISGVNSQNSSSSGHVLDRNKLEAMADRTIVRFRRTANGAGFEQTNSGTIS